MVASLKFYTDSGNVTEAKADLSDAKVIVYKDGHDNKYTLDASSIAGLASIDDIKLSTLKNVVFKYHPNGGTEAATKSLGSIIGALFATQKDQNGPTILAEEVIKKPVVDVLVPALATVGADNTKKVYTKTEAESTFLKTTELATEVATKPVVEAIFNAKDGRDKISETKIGATFAKTDGSNIDKTFAGRLFDAKDGKKFVLVEKLGTFLDIADPVYGATSDQAAKVFLGEKGLKGADGTSPSAANIAAEPALQDHVSRIKIQSPEFREAVQEEMSRSYFDLPTSDAAALNWIW